MTGGGASIGLATADLLARRGWSVAILARDEARLAEASERLCRHGSPVLGQFLADAGAVEHPRREIWVGNSTAVIGIAQSLVPGYADHQVADFKGAQLGRPAPTNAATSTSPWPRLRR